MSTPTVAEVMALADRFAAKVSHFGIIPAQPRRAALESAINAMQGRIAELEGENARLHDDIAAKQHQFVRETLRTSESAQLLTKWAQDAEARGCRLDPWPKACNGCDLMRETKALLEKPINLPSWPRAYTTEEEGDAYMHGWFDGKDAALQEKPMTAANHKLDTDTQVFFYEQDFYVLSNFSAFTLYWRGLRFDTSEAAYHYEKFPDWPEIRAYIKNAPSAHEAFKHAEANKLARRPDWDFIKVGVMLDILRAKATQHEYVRRKLLATGDRELIEDSWRDDFWGWGPNRNGQNMLGKLWMQVRDELRLQEKPE